MHPQTHQIEGDWTELKGKVKEGWGEVTDDDLKKTEGNVQQLIGLIKKKTGQTEEVIADRLAELDERFRPILASAAETASDYVRQGMDAASDTAAYVRDSVAAKHAEAEQMVRAKPLESVAVAFGTGIIAGVVVGLLVRPR